MTISFLNQEKEEITKIDWRIDSYNILGKYMTVKLLYVVLQD